nr:hypothetical protein [Tanacetum cinerariifolium]
MKSIQTFLEEFNYIPFEEKPQILLQAWYKFFTIQHAQPEDSNELFQKLLEDLKELEEYINSPGRDHPIFFNDNEDHYVQHKEYLENSSNEIAASNSNQEKEKQPQDSNIQLLCMHDNVDDLIESALNSKLLSINLNSQRPDQKKREVKNVVEQPVERRTRIVKSLQNFRVIHNSSTSLNNTSQISPVHAVAPILSTKEPEYSPSMGYEHSNTTPEMKSDEIIKSGVEELVPILNFIRSNNDDDISSDDDDFEDIEYVEASLPDPEIVSIEEENVVYQEEEEVDLEDIFQIQDVILRKKLLSINHLIANIKSLNDNPTPDRVLNSSVSFPISEESDNSLSDNFSPEFKTFCDHTEETRSGNTTTHADNSLPEYDLFCFKIKPDQERLINVFKNDIFDDSSNDPLLEEADLFLASDNSIPPGIENFGYDSEGDIRFLEALLSDDSIPFPINESSESDNPSFPRPPPEPPDVEFDFELDSGEEISVVMNDNDELEFFDLGGNIDDEDVDYFPFIFAIRIFLPYLTYLEVFPLFLSAESKDTIFDPGKDYAQNERLINVVKNDISDDSSNDPLLEEADLFLASDNSIPPDIENFADDSEGDIRFLEALLIDDSIPFPNNESSLFDFLASRKNIF